MELTPAQKRKLIASAELVDKGNIAVYEKILEFQDFVDEKEQKIEDLSNKVENEISVIQSEVANTLEYLNTIVQPENGQPGNDYIITEKDKEEIASKVKVPIVEKVIERIETIREVPIVTENVVEKALKDTSEEIVDKVNTSKKKIKKTQVEGLEDVPTKKEFEDVKRIATSNSVALPPTTPFVNGKRSKNFNFIGATVSVTGDTANITTSSGFTVTEVDGFPSVASPTAIKFSNGSVTDNADGTVTVTTGSGGGGDVSSNTATSVDSEVALFSGTGGKTIKRATGTGVPILTSGVLSTSAVTGTELGYLSGVTSAIQTQLNAKGAGTVTSVTSANADATVATTTTTPVITIVSAPKLTTARTIAGVSFDGTANISLNNNAITNGAGYTTNTGTVTSASVVSANGFAGTVATATTTPAITLTTSVTGVLKGNGTAISAAIAGTDYQAPITLTTTGTSGAATLISNTLNIPQYSGGGGTPGGSTTQVQYNNAGAFAGSADFTYASSIINLGASSSATGKVVLYNTLGGNYTIQPLSGASAYVLSLPSATDTLVGKATTDTFTNKTIQGAAVTGALTGTGAYIPVTLLNSGTSASAATFWRGDGTWSTPGGSGTVTNTGGNLTSNSVVLGAGTTDTKVVAGITTDGTSQINLGVNATTLGKVKMFGNTSGDATLQPSAVAGTATVATLPATTTTLAGLAVTQTFTGVNTLTPTARTSGVASYFTITSPADTGQTANTESKGVNVTGSTRTWADGTVATQREYYFGAPTYNKTTTSATFSLAGTLVVGGAPIAGTGVTITNPYSLWVQSGNSHFGSQTGTGTLAGIGGLGIEITETSNVDGGVILQVTNTNGGTNAYGGFNLNNNLASGSTYTNFAGLYYNSSGYTNTSFGTLFATANQLALQNTDGIVTVSAQKDANQYINFAIGGGTTPATTNERFRIDDTKVTVGLAGTTLGKIAFAGNTSGSVTLQGVAVGGSSVLTLYPHTANVDTTITTTEASNATPTVAIAATRHTHTITALAVNATFGAPTIASGTLDENYNLTIRIKDNATARTLAWNAVFRGSTDQGLPTTTVLSKTIYLAFKYNTADTKWDLVSVTNGF